VRKKTIEVADLIARTKPEDFARVVAKMGRPKIEPSQKRVGRIYVYCRLCDVGPELKARLKAARDAYEKKADATTPR